MTRFVCCAGTTRTAAIEGISAAGADPDVMVHTPSADAEILAYGRPVRAPVVPVSPTGCPTPAIVTRAVLDRLGVDRTVVDAGLAEPTGAPTVTVGARPGDDVREQDPVSSAPGAFAAARQFGRQLPDDELFLAETVPGGTTTALGVLTALGEADVLGDGEARRASDGPSGERSEPRGAVSSSLPENPLDLKRRVVTEALEASSLEPGDAAGEPTVALRRAGDPVLAVVAGIAAGALESDTAVTLAGGTQLVAAAACLRHGGYDGPLSLATTSFVADDPSVDLERAARELDLSVTATDPGFTDDHPAMAAYRRGEAKEGVGMGGALALADRADLPMAEVRAGVREAYDDLLAAADDDPLAGVDQEAPGP
jgi:NaMN:DMB phosphoribosyltransferase